VPTLATLSVIKACRKGYCKNQAHLVGKAV